MAPRTQNCFHSAFHLHQQTSLLCLRSPATPVQARPGFLGPAAAAAPATRLSRAPWSKDARESSREDPRSSREKHSSTCLGGMRKREREPRLPPRASIFSHKNPAYSPKFVTRQLWSFLKVCKPDATGEFLQSHSTHWHKCNKQGLFATSSKKRARGWHKTSDFRSSQSLMFKHHNYSVCF